MWGDESEAVAPIIWLYQIVDAQKEEVFFPDLLITLWSYGQPSCSGLSVSLYVGLSIFTMCLFIHI